MVFKYYTTKTYVKTAVYIFFLCFLYTVVNFSFGASFKSSKQSLEENVYPFKGETFYCKCKYSKKSIKPKGCNLKVNKFLNRKYRLEWEHVVPAHAFGHSFKEWRQPEKYCKREKSHKKISPRKCAKRNKLYKEMESNIYNLVPTVGSINAIRSNYSFAELGENALTLCSNGFKILKNKVMPPNNIKGDIARIYMYMSQKYPGRGIISKKNKKLFQAWNKLDPVSISECELSQKKSLVQGEHNPFVFDECKKGIK